MTKGFDLTGKIALVTGAGRGIGKEIARSLAAAGADLFLLARDMNRLEKTADEIRGESGGIVRAHRIDVMDEASVEAAAEFVKKTTGRLDILVNNAALGRGETPLEYTSLEEWNTTMGTNVTGTFLCMKHFGRILIAQKSGSVINLGSMGGSSCLKNCCTGAYDVSKAAVECLTRCMAGEWGKYNIRVNSICPGYTLTEINEDFLADPKNAGFLEKSLDHIPLRRWAKPAEMGDIAVFLASDASSYVTGANIVADGGSRIY
ncbi:MAG: SDR family oxidoreductase [Planctomycetota bacterium]|jgi:NAD(P)-dependent dehydrogenase (short-subunit alcohol dehydrogenase family)|nr:SDR family oxidoreductase [Planctomycetota bacterium]